VDQSGIFSTLVPSQVQISIIKLQSVFTCFVRTRGYDEPVPDRLKAKGKSKKAKGRKTDGPALPFSFCLFTFSLPGLFWKVLRHEKASSLDRRVDRPGGRAGAFGRG
jgi:hypothetical protein